MVLVDQYTASASEIVTGALKDTDRATIIGTTTFGKGVVQSILPMENGGIFKLTTANYFTPDGTNINKIGIEPDVKASDDPKTKRDEALQSALTLHPHPLARAPPARNTTLLPGPTVWHAGASSGRWSLCTATSVPGWSPRAASRSSVTTSCWRCRRRATGAA